MTELISVLAGEGRTARALRRLVHLDGEVRAELRRLTGLKETDFAALCRVREAPCGPTDLAHELHLGTPAVTAVVDRLVAAGHAVREPHPEDRRRTLVRAVDHPLGHALEETLRRRDVVAEAVAALDAEDQATVLAFLEDTAARLERWRDDLAAREALPADRPEVA